MQTRSNYNTLLHIKCVDKFLNAPTHFNSPNLALRKFLVKWINDGKKISPTLIAREYSKVTNSKISYQHIQNLLKQLGVNGGNRVK